MHCNLLACVPAVLLLVSLCTPCSVFSMEDASRAAMLGGQMTPKQKDSLEEEVAKHPDDIESRTRLLGYYFQKGRFNPDSRTAKQGHILWLIENAPEAEVLDLPYGQLDKILERDAYGKARDAWEKTIQENSESPVVLKNASAFFLIHDREKSEELLLKGEKIEPNNPQWPASLGRLYSLGLRRLPEGEERKAGAEKAFRQYESAYNLTGEGDGDHLLADLSKTAFEAGLNDEAKKYATAMLEDESAGWNLGNRIHHGNLILGRIALSEGNVEEAKSRLLLAGKTKGSPQLNSFGPNMELAKELLEQGENEVVLEYFEQCRKFWKMGGRDLDKWIKDVKANRMPKFGSNLAY